MSTNFQYIRVVDRGKELFIKFPINIAPDLIDVFLDANIEITSSNAIYWENMIDRGQAYEIDTKDEVQEFRDNNLKHLKT